MESLHRAQQCVACSVVDKSGLAFRDPKYTLDSRCCRCGKVLLELDDICGEG